MELTESIRRGATSVMRSIGIHPSINTLLKVDHREIRALYRLFQAASRRATRVRGNLATQIMDAVELHARLEEKYFYAALRRKPETHPMLARAELEHRLIAGIIRELRALDASDEGFGPRVDVLSAMFNTHVRFEESELFSKADELIDEGEMRRIGDLFAKERERRAPATRRPLQAPRGAQAAKAGRASSESEAPRGRSSRGTRRTSTRKRKGRKGSASSSR